ncbi:hypothetical protein VTK26DRAFT_2023 [Humicola hyalothermophila]
MTDKIIPLVAVHAAQATMLLTSSLANMNLPIIVTTATTNSNTNQQQHQRRQFQSLFANLLAYLHAWCAAMGLTWWYVDALGVGGWLRV